MVLLVSSSAVPDTLSRALMEHGMGGIRVSKFGASFLHFEVRLRKRAKWLIVSFA